MFDRIQKLCRNNSISIAKLEKDLGFGNGSIYKWEKSSPSIEKVQKVASYFNVSFDYLYYGFELTELSQMINYIKDKRSFEKFSEDTGVPLNELMDLSMGIRLEPPPAITLIKIASSNPVEFLVSEDDLLEAAGYLTERSGSLTRKHRISELMELFEKHNFTLREYKDNYYERIAIDSEEHGTVEDVTLLSFLDQGESILERLLLRYEDHKDIEIVESDVEVNGLDLNDPRLNIFFKDLLKAPEERKAELLRFWKFINEQEKR